MLFPKLNLHVVEGIQSTLLEIEVHYRNFIFLDTRMRIEYIKYKGNEDKREKKLGHYLSL